MRKIDLSSLRNKTWNFSRKYLLEYGLFFIAKRLAGPWGFLASKLLPFLLDKVVKPAWLWTGRKINKLVRRKVGKDEAREIRDAETNDDVFDSINRS